jgi:hypothetical protein
MGFVRLHPSTVQHFRCPLPEPEGSFGQDLPQSWSCSVFVVSHHLDGLLHLGAAGLLHPATGHEVRRVSSSLRQPTRRWPALCAPFPRRGSHPSKNSTRQQPYRVTAALCPPVVTALFAAASSRAGCPTLARWPALTGPRSTLAGLPTRGSSSSTEVVSLGIASLTPKRPGCDRPCPARGRGLSLTRAARSSRLSTSRAYAPDDPGLRWHRGARWARRLTFSRSHISVRGGLVNEATRPAPLCEAPRRPCFADRRGGLPDSGLASAPPGDGPARLPGGDLAGNHDPKIETGVTLAGIRRCLVRPEGRRPAATPCSTEVVPGWDSTPPTDPTLIAETPCPSSLSRSGRLQGLAPPTSP